MVVAVITTNVCIALTFFYLAWRIWQLRGVLARAARKLTAYERATRRGLGVSPPAILLAQAGTYRLRQQYHSLSPRLRQLQRTWLLVGWAFGVLNQLTIGQRARIEKNSEKLS